MVRSAMAVAAMLVVCFWAVARCAEEAVGKGELEMVIRGPHGKPVPAVEVQLTAGTRGPWGEYQQEKGKTDATGRVVVSWPAGVWKIEIAAKGIGYGSTGLVEVLQGKRTEASQAPLAPYAVLEGKVEGWRQGLTLKARANLLDMELEVPVAASGAFRADVPAGWWFVYSTDGKKCLAEMKQSVRVEAGEKATGLVLRPAAYAPPEVIGPKKAEIEGRIVILAQGTVRSTYGIPIPWATVYLFGAGRFKNECIEKAVTNLLGGYTIWGKAEVCGFMSVRLVAYKAGRVPGWAWIQRIGEKADFVLPKGGGTLQVVVLRAGKPAPGVTVQLWREGKNLLDTWCGIRDSPTKEEVEAIMSPIGTTGQGGVVRFEDLVPGNYTVFAAALPPKEMQSFREDWLDAPRASYGEAVGVPVREGQTSTYRISIVEQANSVPVQCADNEGKLMKGKRLSFECGSMHHYGWGAGIPLDQEGLGRVKVEGPGLWRVDLMYRESRSKWVLGRRDVPYYDAMAILGVSPLLEIRNPVALTAMRYDPGTVVVELRDANGEPARGVVEIGGRNVKPTMSGSVAEGLVEFMRVPTWHYLVKGFIAGTKSVKLGDRDEPLPSDDQLRDQVAVLWEPVTTKPNTVQRVALRAQPVGYVLGVVRPPAGRKPRDYIIFLSGSGANRGAELHYQPNTGQFVAGPFAPGKAVLRVWLGHALPCCEKEVVINAGKVTNMEIIPPIVEAPQTCNWEELLVGLAPNESWAERLNGSVFLSDGSTPAFGAFVLLFDKWQWKPAIGGVTDALGRIRARNFLWRSEYEGETSEGPVVVPWLPGANGASMVPLERKPTELRIVLPPCIIIRGKVTVGGAAPRDRAAQVRVLAACEDRGRLNEILSVDTTAQADGSFELAGLTPGKYRVQASLDGMWLSESVALEAGQRQIPRLTLAIGAPGAPVRLKLMDVAGKPLAGKAVTLDRPDGPLTKALWPEEWVADGAGEIYIPSLETGKHKVRVEGTEIIREFAVLPLPTEKETIVAVTVGQAK